MTEQKSQDIDDRFLRYYRRLNHDHLQLRTGNRPVKPKARRALMSEIRRRNKPILELARSLHPQLRKFALRHGGAECILGIEERLARETWHFAQEWAHHHRK